MKIMREVAIRGSGGKMIADEGYTSGFISFAPGSEGCIF